MPETFPCRWGTAHWETFSAPETPKRFRPKRAAPLTDAGKKGRASSWRDAHRFAREVPTLCVTRGRLWETFRRLCRGPRRNVFTSPLARSWKTFRRPCRGSPSHRASRRTAAFICFPPPHPPRETFRRRSREPALRGPETFRRLWDGARCCRRHWDPCASRRVLRGRCGGKRFGVAAMKPFAGRRKRFAGAVVGATPSMACPSKRR